MSLTSYRAAPPRGRGRGRVANGQQRMEDPIRHSPFASSHSRFVVRGANVLGRPGDDLLSRVLRQSTIGAEAFDGRVRDGIGSDRLAEGHQAGEERWLKQNWIFVLMSSSRFGDESDQAERAISTGQLHALLRVHIRPIDVVVFHGSSGRTGFEAGFPLRCLQRLSIPHIATLHCGWRHNRSTRDVFTPVLSY